MQDDPKKHGGNMLRMIGDRLQCFVSYRKISVVPLDNSSFIVCK